MNIFNLIKQSIVHRIASSHLAGPSLPDAVTIYNLAIQRGWSCTFGPWTDPSNNPRTTAECYSNAIQKISDNSLTCYISIKLTALNYDYSLLKELVERAQLGGVRIHFDAMDPDSAPPTFKIIERLLASYKNIGCTLPSRWNRSIQDTEKVIDWAIPVRIVKGQWADLSHSKLDHRKNFLAIIDRLAGKAQLVAVATHDHKLANGSLQRLKESGSYCEMEQLSSLPQNCAHLAKAMNIPMRIYIPYGFPSLPYNLRHVQTRPAIVGWVIRDFILGGRKNLSPID
jgi:proline dehydrogenase